MQRFKRQQTYVSSNQRKLFAALKKLEESSVDKDLTCPCELKFPKFVFLEPIFMSKFFAGTHHITFHGKDEMWCKKHHSSKR